MATYPLVGLQDEFGALVRLSLDRHGISVTEIFDVYEEHSHERYLAIATPLVDDQGKGIAYKKVFAALRDETFTTKSFLDLHTLMISNEKLQEIRRALRKGSSEAHLETLDFLNEVVIRTTSNAQDIIKAGFLHITKTANATFHLVWNSASGHIGKARTVSDFSVLEKTLKQFELWTPSEIDKLVRDGSVSLWVNTSLEVLYKEGFV